MKKFFAIPDKEYRVSAAPVLGRKKKKKKKTSFSLILDKRGEKTGRKRKLRNFFHNGVGKKGLPTLRGQREKKRHIPLQEKKKRKVSTRAVLRKDVPKEVVLRGKVTISAGQRGKKEKRPIHRIRIGGKNQF